jgi:NAD+ kinase
VPEIRRVFLVYKKTALEIYRSSAEGRAMLRRFRPQHALLRRLHRSERTTRATRETVLRELLRAGLRVRAAWRGRLPPRLSADLVVSVGGDGTFLEAAQHNRDVPMLGVNSNPERSVGSFCGARREDFARVLEAVLAGRLRPLPLRRLRARINGVARREPVLNEVLFSSRNPAAMSHYSLRVDGRTEEQKSSGVWIATAAGSTAAIRAAGGRVLPRSSRRFEFLVREPYHGLRCHRLLAGVLAPGSRVELVALMRDAAAYLVGPHVRVPLTFGDRIVVDDGAPPLPVLGLRTRR